MGARIVDARSGSAFSIRKGCPTPVAWFPRPARTAEVLKTISPHLNVAHSISRWHKELEHRKFAPSRELLA